MKLLSKWRSDDVFREAVRLLSDPRFHTWENTDALSAAELAAVRELIGIGALEGRTRGELVDSSRIPRVQFQGMVSGGNWVRKLHDVVFNRTPAKFAPFDLWTLFHDGVVSVRASSRTIGSEVNLSDRKSTEAWIRDRWHIPSDPWVVIERFSTIATSQQNIAAAQAIASPTINVSPIVHVNPAITIDPVIQLSTLTAPTGCDDDAEKEIEKTRPTDGELFAYKAFVAAQKYLRANAGDYNLKVTRADAYEILQAELGREIDRRAAGLPEIYEVPSTLDAFKKALGRASRKLSRGTKETS